MHYKIPYKNPYIEEEQAAQWPREKVQKDKKHSTKHTHKTKVRVTRVSHLFSFLCYVFVLCVFRPVSCVPNIKYDYSDTEL